MPLPRNSKRMSGFVNPKYAKSKAAPVAKREQGYLTVANAGYGLDTTGSVTLLNTVAQGVGISQRVGKKFRMNRLEIIGNMQNGTTATLTDSRWAIVYDKRPTGTLPAVTDIYDGIGPQYFRKEDNAGRFTILKESQQVLTGNATAGNSQNFARNVNSSISLGNKLVVNKSAGTGAIGDIEQGALYLVTMGDQAAGTAAASLGAAFRLRFTDI